MLRGFRKTLPFLGPEHTVPRGVSAGQEILRLCCQSMQFARAAKIPTTRVTRAYGSRASIVLVLSSHAGQDTSVRLTKPAVPASIREGPVYANRSLMGMYWGIMENQMNNKMENEMESTIVEYEAFTAVDFVRDS